MVILTSNAHQKSTAWRQVNCCKEASIMILSLFFRYNGRFWFEQHIYQNSAVEK